MNDLYYNMKQKKKTWYKAVISGVESEEHQVGSKMVSDIFERMGWDTFFLGGNTPLNDLISFIEENKPDVAGLSISVYFNMPCLIKAVEFIKGAFPDLKIIIGGQALYNKGNEIAEKYGAYYIKDLYDLEKYIIRFEEERKNER